MKILIVILYWIGLVLSVVYIEHKHKEYLKDHPMGAHGNYSALDDPEGLVCFVMFWPILIVETLIVGIVLNIRSLFIQIKNKHK